MTNIASNLTELEDSLLASTDDDSTDSVIEDGDICTPFELEEFFQQKYSVQDETIVSLRKDYILSLSKDDSFSRLAAGLSDGSVHLFDINSATGISYSSPDRIAPPSISNSKYPITTCGVRFMDESPNLLLVGTTNNLVRLFDLRTPREVGRFCNCVESEEEPTYMPKNIVCFDSNSNSRILCVGTEQHNSTVFLLFYDLRERKKLGGYFESHQDDITSVRFHPQNPDLLCSGSTDGLINIFDIHKSMEDNALLMTLNTDSSVHKLNWHKNVYDHHIISCITHTNDLKLYESKEGKLLAAFERAEITEAVKRKAAANCNLIDCHNMEDGNIFVLTGSNVHKGDTMRSLLVQNTQLLPAADFRGNKQIVRESLFDISSNVLITAGESGIVTLWGQQTSNSFNNNLKLKVKKSKKIMPY